MRIWGCGGMVDTADLKSVGLKGPWRFDSFYPHINGKISVRCVRMNVKVRLCKIWKKHVGWELRVTMLSRLMLSEWRRFHLFSGSVAQWLRGSRFKPCTVSVRLRLERQKKFYVESLHNNGYSCNRHLTCLGSWYR